jgi:hypothetical protein
MNDLLRRVMVAAAAGAVLLGLIALGVAYYRARNPAPTGATSLDEKYPEFAAPDDRDFRTAGVTLRATDRSRVPNELDLADAAVFYAAQAHLIATVTTIPLVRQEPAGTPGYAPVAADPVAVGVILKGGYASDPRMYGCLDALNTLASKGEVRRACGFLGDVDFLPVSRNDGA